MFLEEPPRNRKIYAGPNVDQLLEDFYPPNTIEVSGESFHFAQLGDIARFVEARPDYFHQVEAYLTVEPENSFDKNAVAVFIHNSKVGYVNKLDAPAISAGVSRLGGSAWVMAAIKEVSSLRQFRIRLMLAQPIRLDPRAFPLIDVTEIAPPPLNEVMWNRWQERNPFPADLFETISEEEMGLDEQKGPDLILLTLATNFVGASEVVIFHDGSEIARVLADDYPELFEAVLEVNQAAWTPVFFHIDEDTATVEMQFLETKGVLTSSFPNPAEPAKPEEQADDFEY